MTKAILVIGFFIGVLSVQAQTTIDSDGVEIFHIDSLFEDVSINLLKSQVTEIKGINQSEIKRRILNYASGTFPDVREVLVSESDDQLIFNFVFSFNFKMHGSAITGPVSFEEHIRLVVQIKNERFRVLVFDDGNAQDVGIAARTTYFSQRFRNSIARSKGPYKVQYVMIQAFDDEVNSILTRFTESGSNQVSGGNRGIDANW